MNVPERGVARVPTIEELEGGGYTRLVTLRHVDLVDFAADYFWRRVSWFSRIHHALSFVMLALVALAAWHSWSGLAGFAKQAGLAFLSFVVVLLPVHEALHALGYLIVGARNLRWSWTSRGMAVYVMAHREVVASAPFAFVALVPFVVIDTALFAAALFLPQYSVFFLTALLLHHGGTSGDWALLHYLVENSARPLFTYDDCDLGETYFFAGQPDGARAGLPASVGTAAAPTRAFISLVWAATAAAAFAGAIFIARHGALPALIAGVLLVPYALTGSVGAIYVAFPNSRFGVWLDLVLPSLRRAGVATAVAAATLLASALVLATEWSLRNVWF